MNTNFITGLGILALSAGLFLPQAHAAMELDKAYFTGKTMIKPGADQKEEDASYEAGFLHDEYYLNGTVTIKNFDPVTYAKEIITIPAHLKVEKWGVLADARLIEGSALGSMVLPIESLGGKPIADLFTRYSGAQVDVHVLLGTGYKRLSNQYGISLKGWDGPRGFGFDLSYVRMTLSPGIFVPGKEVHISGITRTEQAGTVVETKDIPLESLMSVTVPN